MQEKEKNEKRTHTHRPHLPIKGTGRLFLLVLFGNSDLVWGRKRVGKQRGPAACDGSVIFLQKMTKRGDGHTLKKYNENFSRAGGRNDT